MDKETKVENPVILSVEKFNWFIDGVRFPKMNKNETLDEYKYELVQGCDTQRVQVAEILLFDDDSYRNFCENLLTDFGWLDGKGGFDSTYDPVDQDGEPLSYDKLFGGKYPIALEAWRKESYTIGLLCVNTKNKLRMIVDPEGHRYARYVGFLPDDMK